MVPDLPEELVAGKERLYLSWFYDHAFIKTTINAADVTCMNHDKEYDKTKLTMPVLALAGDHSFGISIFNLMQSVANDVRGCVVQVLIPHWTPDIFALAKSEY